MTEAFKLCRALILNFGVSNQAVQFWWVWFFLCFLAGLLSSSQQWVKLRYALMYSIQCVKVLAILVNGYVPLKIMCQWKTVTGTLQTLILYQVIFYFLFFCRKKSLNGVALSAYLTYVTLPWNKIMKGQFSCMPTMKSFWYDKLNRTWLVLTYDLLEDRGIDDITITNCLLFIMQNK